jgi:hypothetical protein
MRAHRSSPVKVKENHPGEPDMPFIPISRYLLNSTFWVHFFANRFDRPMTMLTNVTLQVRQVLTNVSSFLPSSSSNTQELPEEIE